MYFINLCVCGGGVNVKRVRREIYRNVEGIKIERID